jgi:transposase
VAELERRLGKDSSNSSKPPSSDGLGKPARAGRRAAERVEGRRPGKQPGAPGAHLAQVATPDEVVEHLPERCGGCGAELADAPVAGVEARQVFDLPPLGLRVTEHRAERRRCACGSTTAAAFPAHVRAAACYGPGVRALVGYLCAYQHLPMDRAAQLLADVLGASMATGTLAAMVAEGARGLEEFVEAVRWQLAAAPVAHFDETGAKRMTTGSVRNLGRVADEVGSTPATGSAARRRPPRRGGRRRRAAPGPDPSSTRWPLVAGARHAGALPCCQVPCASAQGTPPTW